MKVINLIKEIMSKKVVVKKTEQKLETNTCKNCTLNGEHCSVCTPVFVDTFK